VIGASVIGLGAVYKIRHAILDQFRIHLLPVTFFHSSRDPPKVRHNLAPIFSSTCIKETYLLVHEGF